MKKQDWIYMDGYDEVITADTREVVFKTNELECVDRDDTNSVVDTVVSMHNAGKDFEDIQDYLLDEGRCTTEDMEIILEDSYANYYDKLPKTPFQKHRMLEEIIQYHTEDRSRVGSDHNSALFAPENPIGRLLSDEARKELNRRDENIWAMWCLFPENIQAYGKTFLERLQALEDNQINWYKKRDGLSARGQKVVGEIRLLIGYREPIAQ